MVRFADCATKASERESKRAAASKKREKKRLMIRTFHFFFINSHVIYASFVMTVRGLNHIHSYSTYESMTILFIPVVAIYLLLRHSNLNVILLFSLSLSLSFIKSLFLFFYRSLAAVASHNIFSLFGFFCFFFTLVFLLFPAYCLH